MTTYEQYIQRIVNIVEKEGKYELMSLLDQQAIAEFKRRGYTVTLNSVSL